MAFPRRLGRQDLIDQSVQGFTRSFGTVGGVRRTCTHLQGVQHYSVWAFYSTYHAMAQLNIKPCPPYVTNYLVYVRMHQTIMCSALA